SGAPTSFQYLDTAGNYQSIAVNYQSLSIKTNFGCTGVTDYTGTASLPSSIVLPNGQQYTITYEPTPGFPGYFTGRVQQITYATGGSIQYSYPGPNDGINCSDGSTVSLTRVVSDGVNSATWQYSR